MGIKIKICGMRDPDNIRAVMRYHPDYLGFIFYPASKRYVNELDRELLNSLEDVKRTAVFVNADLTTVKRALSTYGFEAVQLHGDESPDFCKEIQDEGVEVIKAFGIHSAFQWDVLEEYEAMVDYFLFDTQTPIYGGAGKTFEWSVLQNYPLEKPYFLSGGISPDNFEKAYRLSDERLYGLDLNSRFELSPGIKDINLLNTVLNK